MNVPELVAPGGSFEAMEAAFDHGADAVYAGLSSYNLRARAPNFDIEGFEHALRHAHERGKRLYLALNTMPTAHQTDQIGKILDNLSDRRAYPDAVIVSDPGVMDLCRGVFKEVPLHLSTQTGAFNVHAARFWLRNGISRIVVPRELNLDQARALCDAGIPCEIFIHGAMCVSLSGRCLLGAYLAGRHANHGDCPQPCRYRYRIIPEGGTEELEAEENGDGVYLLNARDLNTLSILDRIVATGATAL
ncbi:MAG: hypothetical protein GF344_13605, partial [Chitinivibrionales bacterium]|nr:hypothetical protein [Chitinivibrionales bacterium]MBD3357766.1 hypothetical protein [Chitinivibrionales bacterium]